MKPLSAAAEKALKHRQWHWCRRPNGFSDMPRWRVVATRLGLPTFQVVAFVNRLEEFANAAEHRGHVGYFDAFEFGEALGMPSEDAARIFAALEDGERPWIEGDHVANFFGRNPDTEDTTYIERKRRSRTRTDVLKRLADLAHRGLIDAPQRHQIEATLRLLPDPELFALQARLGRDQLSTPIPSHGVTDRDSVTVTPEQSTQISKAPGDNFSERASGTGAGSGETRAETPALDPQQQAELWLATDGTRIVTEQLQENRQLASTKIARWRDQELGGDAAALVEVIKAADRAGVFGLRFLNLIVDGIAQVKRRATAQAELPMPPVLASERKMA